MQAVRDFQAVAAVLTTQCNLRCAYCYQSSKDNRRMDWKTLRACIDAALTCALPEVKFLFFGGEPLMEMPMIRRAVADAESRRPADLGVRFGLSTNGTLLDEANIAFLVENGFEVQLSFDGVPGAQDLRGRGTFKALDGTLGHVSRRHPAFFTADLSIALTLSLGTLPHLADSVEYFLAKDVRELVLSPDITLGWGWNEEQTQELDVQFERIYEASLNHLEAKGRIPLPLFRGTGNGSERPADGDLVCSAARGTNLIVDVDGRVHTCSLLVPSYQALTSELLLKQTRSMELGSLLAHDFWRGYSRFREKRLDAEMFTFRNKRRSASYGRCGECQYLPDCTVCPVSIGHLPDNDDPYLVPDFVCAFNRVSIEHARRFTAAVVRREGDEALGRMEAVLARRAAGRG